MTKDRRQKNDIEDIEIPKDPIWQIVIVVLAVIGAVVYFTHRSPTPSHSSNLGLVWKIIIWTAIVIVAGFMLFLMFSKPKKRDRRKEEVDGEEKGKEGNWFTKALSFLPKYRTLGRWTINLFRLMGVVGAAFLIYYIVSATKAWSFDVKDRLEHPMKDRGEVAANCVTCNTETKVDQLKLTQQKKGKVPFKKGESLDFERKFNVTRKYKLVDGQKEAILTITSPTHTWKVMVTPEGDYLDSGTTDPVEGWCTIKSDRDAVIKVTYVQ